jgi:hypothetical protein
VKTDLVVVGSSDEQDGPIARDVKRSSRSDLSEEDGNDNLPCKAKFAEGEGGEGESSDGRSARQSSVGAGRRGRSASKKPLLTERKSELVGREAVEDKRHCKLASKLSFVEGSWAVLTCWVGVQAFGRASPSEARTFGDGQDWHSAPHLRKAIEAMFQMADWFMSILRG